MKIKSITDIKNLAGKRVLVRVDFNVPVKNGKVVTDFKIRQTIPTIEFLLKHDARVILVSHLGRPQAVDKKLSLRPVCKQLEKLIGKPVQFVSATKTAAMLKSAASEINRLLNGGMIMLENIRFFPEEQKADKQFSKSLAALADIFVSDCFAVSHHPAVSISGVAQFLPSYGGLLVAQEIKGLSQVMEKPKKPLVVILGGAKAETKIPIVKNLLPKADYILVSGGFFNTYLWAKGFKVGASMIQKEFKKDVLKYAKNKKLILPVDVVVGDRQGHNVRVVPVDKHFAIKGKDLAVFDIGPKTVQLFSGYIKKAKTLIWNGAMGMFEVKPYHYGTFAMTHLFAARSKGKAFGVCGGGETVQVFEKLHLADDVDLVSTGGGAMLDFLSGKKLPGIEALKK